MYHFVGCDITAIGKEMNKETIAYKMTLPNHQDPSEQSEEHATREYLSERVYHALKEAILCCDFAPGDHVNESDLAQWHGVSRTPVREALNRLMQEGFVEVVPRKGYKITPITVRDVQETFSMRIILEGEAAAFATPIISEEQLNTLDNILKVTVGMDMSHGDDSSRMAYLEANNQFHICVAKASGNQRLARTVIGLLEEAARFIYIESGVVGLSGIEESQRIIEAMRARDAQMARQLMREHIQATYDRVIEVILSGTSEIIVGHKSLTK